MNASMLRASGPQAGQHGVLMTNDHLSRVDSVLRADPRAPRARRKDILGALGALPPLEPQIAHASRRKAEAIDAPRRVPREDEDPGRHFEAVAIQRLELPRATGRREPGRDERAARVE